MHSDGHFIGSGWIVHLRAGVDGGCRYNARLYVGAGASLMTDSVNIVPVLLSGGAGSRLWPLSRPAFPKQFLVLGEGEDSLLQASCRRLMAVAGAQAPVVVCNEEHRFLVAQQLLAIGCTPQAILLEPEGRNTAPALALAALHQEALGRGDALLLVSPADHLLHLDAVFHEAVARAAHWAAEGELVTFGIEPRSPETGYGYIRQGEMLAEGAFRVAAFVEKPDRATAETYVRDGGFWWNSGLFLLRADRYLEELQRWAPTMLAACRAAFAVAQQDLDFIRLPAAEFALCPSDSIDYAVMEHTDRAAVVPLSSFWSDIGSWSALWETGSADADGNVTHGDVLLDSARHNLAHSESRLLALLGVENLVVVETADAVLVADRERVQDVRRLVKQLTDQGRDEAISHLQVFRPWGSYESLVSAPGFQVKRIVVNPGASLSLQLHHHRSEHWIVVSGEAEVVRGEERFRLQHDESTYIPVGCKHRLHNPAEQPLILIEVQTGDYLGEDDIVRFDDHYGRSAASSSQGDFS